MTAKKFYDWQTVGGTDDVMRLVDCLERADIPWCAIGGVAVNHWAAEPMVTQDVDFVVATEAIERATEILTGAGFRAEKFKWSINFKGHSKVSLQLSTEDFYRGFPSRAVAADVHGILLRVASLEVADRDREQGTDKRELRRRCARRDQAVGRVVVADEIRDRAVADVTESCAAVVACSHPSIVPTRPLYRSETAGVRARSRA